MKVLTDLSLLADEIETRGKLSSKLKDEEVYMYYSKRVWDIISKNVAREDITEVTKAIISFFKLYLPKATVFDCGYHESWKQYSWSNDLGKALKTFQQSNLFWIKQRMIFSKQELDILHKELCKLSLMTIPAS
jgi:hypothetical protein